MKKILFSTRAASLYRNGRHQNLERIKIDQSVGLKTVWIYYKTPNGVPMIMWVSPNEISRQNTGLKVSWTMNSFDVKGKFEIRFNSYSTFSKFLRWL